MKTSCFFFYFVALLALLSSPAHAQLFTSKTVGGAILGASTGAIVGNRSHDTGKGTLIGGLTGYAIGLTAEQISNQHQYTKDSRVGLPSPARRPVAHPNAGKYSGVVIGGVAGAIIGNRRGETGKDAAIGAAAGLLVGAITDHFRGRAGGSRPATVVTVPDDLRDCRSPEQLYRIYGDQAAGLVRW